MNFRCNTCGGTYTDRHTDGSPYFHACPPDTITVHQVVDATGKVITPEVRVPLANRRDENYQPGQSVSEGKTGRVVADPHDSTHFTFVEGPLAIVSEGKGRTPIP